MTPTTAPSATRPMFEFPLPVEDLWAERTSQFLGSGIPRRVLRQVKRRVTDSWVDGPGGWTYEWTAAARDLEARGRWLPAALAYGAGRFPSLASESRQTAQRDQLRAFARATHGSVTREVIAVPYRGGTTAVLVHRYSCRRPHAVLCLTGGVDTWKVELHRLAAALRTMARIDVVIFDMPGTGESEVPLAGDAEVIYRGVVDAVRADGLPVGVMGMSFGGLWAAKLAVEGGVDFAIDLGGPVGASERDSGELLALPNGMPGIVAHALWLDELPAAEDLPGLLDQFSLRDALDRSGGRLRAPLLAVNGTADQYLPRHDLEVFRPFPEATVWAVEGATHCAVEQIVPVMIGITAWINANTRRSFASRALIALATWGVCHRPRRTRRAGGDQVG